MTHFQVQGRTVKCSTLKIPAGVTSQTTIDNCQHHKKHKFLCRTVACNIKCESQKLMFVNKITLQKS